MTLDERIDAYIAYFRDEGYRPVADRQGDIAFTSRNIPCRLLLEERDEEFVQIIIPEVWVIADEDGRAAAEAAALEVTGKSKVVKVYIIGDMVLASIELFVATPEDCMSVLPRCLSALGLAAAAFLQHLRAQT